MEDYDFISFSCIKQDINQVRDNIVTFYNNEFSKCWEIEENEVNIKSIYFPRPLAGGAHFMKILLWEPIDSKGWTIFMNNYQDGGHSLIYNLSKLDDYKIYFVRMSNLYNQYPAYTFEFLSKDNTRIIQSIKDDNKWNFYAKGEILKIENPENYNKKKIKERLNSEIIIQYLYKIGFDVRSFNFWHSDKEGIYLFQHCWK